MITSPTRYYLPTRCLEQYGQLEHLVRMGLPSEIRWQFRASGPEYSFHFYLLSEGGNHYENVIVERTERYFPDIGRMLRIGSYIYSFLDLQQRADVCVRTTDASLWIVDLNRDSIALTNAEGRSFDRIPVFRGFLNGNPDRFEKCIDAFLPLVERFRKPSRDEEGRQRAWLGFERLIRQVDPEVFLAESSFWGSVIGDRLGPF